MFRNLLDRVRVKGTIEVASSPFLKDMLPIVYGGEADSSKPNAVEYYNSGGRALIFEKGGETYRVKGVDPFGKLTERVSSSANNRIENVSGALFIASTEHNIAAAREGKGMIFLDDKPFGVLYKEQAEREEQAFQELGRIYRHLGIKSPCEFALSVDTGVQTLDKKTYQTAFRLPSPESDLRVREWDALLTERLDECSPEEIEAKRQTIGRLYGRFVYWAGVNTAMLAATALVPTMASFVPQNWVIDRHHDGYGLFRVDHTSTKRTNPEAALKELTQCRETRDILPASVNEFSVFASRMQIAAKPKEFLPPGKTDLRFSKILTLDPREIRADERKVVNVHKFVFEQGLAATLQGHCPEPIPEELFKQALS